MIMLQGEENPVKPITADHGRSKGGRRLPTADEEFPLGIEEWNNDE
jgi:hypothetical protein